MRKASNVAAASSTTFSKPCTHRRTKERGSKVLDELKKNAAGADSRSQKLAEKFIAKGRAAKGSIAVSHIPGTEDTVRYEIEAAKSGR